MTRNEEFIDVKILLQETSPEQLNQLAEEYFAQVKDWNYHLAKPFGAIDQVPQLLMGFSVVFQGLKLCSGMTIMEFGAGTCWASRFLNQLGCQVIAVDVSPTALRMGQELYTRQPLIGDQPKPQFLVFDGKRLDLPNESIDRVICLDAFHHVPNPDDILFEMARVLRQGGIAGFAEPGPEHSKSAQSQYEMRTHRVVENDVDIHRIWKTAQTAGFTDIKLALLNIPPVHLGIKEFDDFLSGGKTTKTLTNATREFMKTQRIFFLSKGEPEPLDSRYPNGLVADIRVAPQSLLVDRKEPMSFQANVTNSSESIWLSRDAGRGAVYLGCHVYSHDGKLLRESYHWEPLKPDDGVPVRPEESVQLSVNVPALPPGRYILEFDMVSSDVCWFAKNGSVPCRVSVQVV